MSAFKLNIFTPGGPVIENMACEELTIPTASGLINVLKGHTHLISELDTGILKATIGTGQVRHFTIAGGLLKILGSEVKVLAKTSEAPEKIDIERAKAAEKKAADKLAGSLPTVETIKFRRKLERAKNRIRLANLK
ncbi:MAG: ATP synthase F1 subunit epsilon [Halobacteriovoraceae bacterium]|nr:ATP synthase F1 subunit epsilon [Halobacteriovoraceae bacterium]|tara:strand:- start:6830 stop:7237 length:408 start_codon:yes stop_codon:yes gene_type:complete